MSRGTYQTPKAMKDALEARVRNAAKRKKITIEYQRLLVNFDRLIARLHKIFEDKFLLKGALALRARASFDRTTKDLDVLAQGNPDDLIKLLKRAGNLDLNDHFRFEISLDRKHPDILGEGAVYGGKRFKVQAYLVGRPYGIPFGVDVAVGPLVFGEPELLPSPENMLDFISIPTPSCPVYPRETHLAEKLHAYTQPRERPNSRIKDLPDIAFLAQTGVFQSKVLKKAIDEVFGFRKSHLVPDKFPDPPASWGLNYPAFAKANDLPWQDLDELMALVRSFLDPVLEGLDKEWDPDSWSWG